MDNEFESAFDKFLDSSSYDSAEEMLFQLLRGAFAAGWKAAKDTAPEACDE